MTVFKSVLGFVFIIMLQACSTGSVDAESSGASGSNANTPANQSVCSDPRLPFCTREYRPVCATLDTGIRCVTTPCESTEQRTYSNACTACADESVISHQPGICQ